MIDRCHRRGERGLAVDRVGAVPSGNLDAAHGGLDFASAIGSDPTARAIAKLLRAGHRTHHASLRQGAIAAHPALEQQAFQRSFDQRHRSIETVVANHPQKRCRGLECASADLVGGFEQAGFATGPAA
jgi:hypothetical protein